MRDEKYFTGNLSIGHPQPGDTFRIMLEDESSGTLCVEIEILPEHLALAMVGHSLQPCKFLIRPEMVGKVREHKAEVVRVYRTGRNNLWKFEVDGWSGRESDMQNHHCVVDSDYEKGWTDYRVVFTRHVDAEAAK